MFRIDTRPVGSTRIDVRLSGRLAEGRTSELSAELDRHRRAGRTVHLDLSGLTGVDHVGLALLVHLVGHGVHLARCPAFLTLWLRAEHHSRIRDGS